MAQAPSDRGRTKGSVFASRLKFLREKGGEALVERVLAKLPKADREMLRGLVLAASWYPFDMNERLDAAIVGELGGGDELFRELGRQSALHNLSASHKNFIRARDPHGLFRQAASICRVYYDTGSRTYEKLGPTKAVLRTGRQQELLARGLLDRRRLPRASHRDVRRQGPARDGAQVPRARRRGVRVRARVELTVSPWAQRLTGRVWATPG